MLYFRNSEIRQTAERPHSATCAIMEVSVGYYKHRDVEANRGCYKVGQGEEDGQRKQQILAQ